MEKLSLNMRGPGAETHQQNQLLKQIVARDETLIEGLGAEAPTIIKFSNITWSRVDPGGSLGATFPERTECRATAAPLPTKKVL